jgi:hypothetical protein
MAGIVPHLGFHPDGLGGNRKMHFQGDGLAHSHALKAAEAEAAFGDAISLRVQGGDLPLTYQADHEGNFGLEPGGHTAIRSA